MAHHPYALFTITVAQSMLLLRPVLDELIERGWSVRVVVSEAEPGEEQWVADVPVSHIEMTRAVTPVRDLKSVLKMTSLIRRERPDVVIGSTPKAAMVGLAAAKIARVRHRVFLVRGARWDGTTGSKAQLLRLVDRVPVASATEIVAVSPSLAKLLHDERITSRPVHVFGRGGSKGVDLERFRPRERVPGQPPTLAFVGRLAEDKGISDVLSVFEYCRARLPDLELKVVGALDPAQPISEDTQRRLVQPGVERLGTIDWVDALLPSIDLLVFPSVREGLPNVVIEAAACGVPTVAYRATGVVDAVEDGVTGRLVAPGDVPALSRVALELLISDALEPMGRSARVMAENWFDQRKVVGDFVEFLEAQVQGTGGGAAG